MGYKIDDKWLDDGTSLSPKADREVIPQATDGAALGSGSVMWSDLFLASAAAINFNNGDVTLTHGANTLTMAGGDLQMDGDIDFVGAQAITTTAGNLTINPTGDAIISPNSNTTITLSERVGSFSYAGASGSATGYTQRYIQDDGAAMAIGHRLGSLEFQGAEDAGSTLVTGARIAAIADANWSATENGTYLAFSVNDGNDTLAEALRITAPGALVLGASEGVATAHTGNTFRAADHPGGTDTDSAGADLTISAGLGTGDGDAGTIIFSLPEVVGSGTTVQTRAAAMTLDMVASTTVATMTLNVNWIVSGTWNDLGSVTTVDINGGTIDGITSLTVDADLDFTGAQAITTSSGDLTLNPTGNIALGGNDITGASNITANASTELDLIAADVANGIRFYTTDDAGPTATLRLTLTGTVDTAVATWAAITHTGISITSGATIAFADETVDIGTSSVGLNDLHFGSGGIINFDGGNATITHSAGILTFNVFPVTPSAAPDADYEVANKKYVDDSVATVDTWAEVLALGNTSGATDVLINNGQGLVIGHSAQVAFGEITSEMQVMGTTETDASMAIGLWSETDALAPTLKFMKSGHAAIAVGNATTVANNEELGKIQAYGADGTDLDTLVAEIGFFVDDAGVGTGQIAGEIILATAADTGTLTTAITISGTQVVTFANTIVGSINGNAATVTNATLTTALTVNTGTLTLTANVANTSVLTIGAGAVSVSGTNTGDQTNISGNAATVTVDATTTDTTCFVLLGESDSGSLEPQTDATLAYNATTGNLAATTFTGALAGNATTATDTASKTGTGSTYATNTSPTFVTPLLGTPTSGVLTSCTGLPAAAVVAGSLGTGAYVMDSSLQVSTIELGHATENTLSAASGVLSVEGVVVPTISSTNTLTNKRITARVTTEASAAEPTINTDNADAHSITALAEAITSMTTNLSGTPTNFQKLTIRFLDNGTGRAIAWGASFEDTGVALPNTTVANKVLTAVFIYDTASSKFGCVEAYNET